MRLEDIDPSGIVVNHESKVDRWSVRSLDSNPDAGTTTFIASTDDEDRALDIVKQDWRLRNFRNNPVILDNHDPMRVVGRAESVKVPKNGEDAGSLVIRVAWDLDSPDPSIANVGRQHLKGIRKAGSVGFRSGRKTARNRLPTDSPYYREPMTFQSVWGDYEHAGILHEKNELLEFSSATIPMNPSALQRSLELRTGTPEDISDFDACVAIMRRLDEDPAFAGQLRKRLFADDEVFYDMLALHLPKVLRGSDNHEIRRVIVGILEARAPAVKAEPRMVPGEGPFGYLFPTIVEEGS